MSRARRRIGWRVVAALAAAGIGGACLGHAGAIHAKAWLGQALIARAWQLDVGGEGEARQPWPWADTRPVARLQVPAHGVDVIVLAGGSGRTLAWGPGHLAGTARVGGPGNAVVGGHRDTHFSFLRDVAMGEEIFAEDGTGARRAYRVTGAFVTHERDTSVLSESAGRRLTLVTCWPFDAHAPGGPERYVVVADGI